MVGTILSALGHYDETRFIDEDTGPKWLDRPSASKSQQKGDSGSLAPRVWTLTPLLQESPGQAGTHPAAWSHSAGLCWLPSISLTETQVALLKIRWPLRAQNPVLVRPFVKNQNL